MRTGDIQQLIMNLANNVDRNSSLKLNPGQVVSMLLKEIQGNMALLSYQGQEIMAKLETEVPVGEKLRCLVVGEKNNQIILRVLNSASEEADIRFKSVMNHVGIEENDTNLTLIKEMVNRQMPLNNEKIRLFSAFVRNYNVPDAEAWIPVFMDSRGIPLTENAFKACRDILGNMNNLHNDITNLDAQIKSLLNEVKPNSAVGQLAQKISNILDYLVVRPNESKGETADKLFNVFRLFSPGNNTGEEIAGKNASVSQLPQPAEVNSGTAQLLSNQKTVNTNQKTVNTNQQSVITNQNINAAGLSDIVIKADSAEDDTTKFGTVKSAEAEGDHLEIAGQGKSDINQKAKDILERFSLLLKDTPVKLGDHTKNPLGEIRKLLDLYGNQLQEEGLPELLEKMSGLLKKEGEHAHRELASLVSTTADKLEVIRTFNNTADIGREQMAVMYSRIDFGSREEPVRILLNYRNKGKGNQQDFSNCSIKVSLNTANMGYVKCEVQFSSRTMSLQFSADNDGAAKSIEMLQSVLGQRLEEMNYTVNILPCRVEKEPEYMISNPENSIVPGLFQVNLTI